MGRVYGVNTIPSRFMINKSRFLAGKFFDAIRRPKLYEIERIWFLVDAYIVRDGRIIISMRLLQSHEPGFVMMRIDNCPPIVLCIIKLRFGSICRPCGIYTSEFSRRYFWPVESSVANRFCSEPTSRFINTRYRCFFISSWWKYHEWRQFQRM